MKVTKRDRVGIIIFLFPALILFITFFLFPILYVTVMSFFDWNGISAPTFTGLGNYAALFSDQVFLRSIRNNVIWALAACFIQVPLALLMAIILSKKPRFWKFFRTVYFFPQVISSIALAALWSAIFNSEFGVINSFLKLIGLESLATNWLGNPATAFPCVLIYGLFYIGYYMVIMMASISSIDTSYYEAAMIDGASGWQIDIYITIPMIKYAMLTCTTLAAVFGLRTFEQIFMLTNGGPANRTSVVVLYLYNLMKKNDYGGANASSVILIIVGAIVIAGIRKLFSLRNNDD